MNRIWAVIACSLCILGVVAHAADDPQTGNWKMNLAKSKFVTSTAPRSQTVTVVPYGKDGVSLTVDIVTATGEKANIQYSASYDGKPYPRTETGAGAVSGQTVTLKHIDSQTAERIAYLAGKTLVTERWVISKDGKTRTVSQTGVDAQGKPVNNVLFYERQ